MPTSNGDVLMDTGAFDVLVIGAGPAGLAAATSAARGGASVALLDAAMRPGGQYWRHRDGDDGRGHHDWDAFKRLRGELERERAAGRIAHLVDHAVWHLERTPGADGFTAHIVHAGADREVTGRTVVIATGAYDRQLPFPGWTLPGVFTAGGVQALLKGQGVVAGRRVVVAGTGPFLLPVAVGLAEAGAEVASVVEANNPLGMATHPLAALRNLDKLAEAAGYLRALRHHLIPYRTRHAVVAAHGTDAVDAVTVARLDADWRVVPGSLERIACDAVAVGYGFTPQIELADDLGCAVALDTDGSLVVTVDAVQRTSVDGAFAAGETCGVGGAALAVAEGALAGLHAAAAVAGTRPDRTAVTRLERERARRRVFAAVMPLVWPVRSGWRSWLADDTLVCRCEEVPVSAVRGVVTGLGALDARGAKLFSRTGMGLCQGRVCGYATAHLVAAAAGRLATAADIASTVKRPIAWPITLGALAAGPITDDPATPSAIVPAREESTK